MRKTSGDRNFSLVGTRPLITGDLGMKLYEFLEDDAIRAQFKRLYQDEPSGAGGLDTYSSLNMYVHRADAIGRMARSIGCSSGAGAASAPDLMVLIGFESIADELTDSRTICRFRSRKANGEFGQKPPAFINCQLWGRRLEVQGVSGYDAIIVRSAAPPQRVESDGKRTRIIDSVDSYAR